MSEPKAFELQIAANPRFSSVLLDGEMVPGVYRIVVDCGLPDISTRIEIHAYKQNGDPYVIKGYMVEDES